MNPRSLVLALSFFLASAGARAAPPNAAPPPPAYFVPQPDPKATPSPTIKAIRAAGRLDCAVVSPPDDWNNDDAHGDLSRFEAQFCVAIGVAVLGEGDKTNVRVLPGEAEAVAALHTGVVQVAIGLSPSIALATAQGLAYGRPVFYDSVRVLTHKSNGVHDAAGLKGQLICAMNQSFAETTLEDEMHARGLNFGLQSHSELSEDDAAVAARRCAAGVGLETRLAQSRASYRGFTPTDFVFLPERWGPAPMTVATRIDDPYWTMAVDRVVGVLIGAEEAGIDKANVGQARKRSDLRAREVTGQDVAIAYALGLDVDWSIRAIAAVGNYGEIFDRTVAGPYRIERGLNALWSSGGLMTAGALH